VMLFQYFSYAYYTKKSPKNQCFWAKKVPKFH